MGSLAVIIAAGGSGGRFGGAKQFGRLCGKTVLERSVSAFSGFGDIFAVCPAGDVSRAKTLLGARASVIPGGGERGLSVLNGLLACAGAEYALIHDGARPLVSKSVINRVISALKEHSAVIPAIPVTDTIVRVSSGLCAGALNRAELAAAQTPQGFAYKTVMAAYRAWIDDGAPPLTDDASLVSRYLNEPVFTVPGDAANIKITYPGDLRAARLLLRQASRNSTPIED